jgi:hypothetical protein
MSSDVQVLSLTCNHCGAPLDVPEAMRFVTCEHCGSRLEVHRTGSAAYTQVLEQIDQRTRNIEQDIEALRLQQELEQLDRDWATKRKGLMDRNGEGQTSVPTALGNVIGAMGLGVCGLVWLGIGSFMGHAMPGFTGGLQPFFTWIGLGVVVLAVILGISGMGKASAYRNAEILYQQQRAALLARIGQYREA